MSDSESWDIGHLADLILGTGAKKPGTNGLSSTGSESKKAEPARPLTHDPGVCRPVVLLVNPTQDAIDAVGRYADYWSNRGEAVAALWMGNAGIKAAIYDCARRRQWASTLLEPLEKEPVEALPMRLATHCHRLVVGVVTTPGWLDSPILARAQAFCVAVEPAPYQLIGSYDSFKSLIERYRGPALSCFVVGAGTAQEAQVLGERFYRMGDEFLDEAIAFDGFSLPTTSAMSSCVAEGYVPAGDRADTLQQALLEFLETHAEMATIDVEPPSATVADVPLPAVEPDMTARDDISTTDLPQMEVPSASGPHVGLPVEDPVAPTDAVRAHMQLDHSASRVPQAAVEALPVVRVFTLAAPIACVAGLDSCIERQVADLVTEVTGSWPVHTLVDHARYRWVQRDAGRRSVIVSTLAAAQGLLEQATACLYPQRDDDEIVLIAPHLPSEVRRAAHALSLPVRMYEVARLPNGQQPGLVLHEVTAAV